MTVAVGTEVAVERLDDVIAVGVGEGIGASTVDVATGVSFALDVQAATSRTSKGGMTAGLIRKIILPGKLPRPYIRPNPINGSDRQQKEPALGNPRCRFGPSNRLSSVFYNPVNSSL